MKIIIKILSYLCVSLSFLLSSCEYSDTYYSDFKPIEYEGWKSSEPVRFEVQSFDSIISPGSQLYITLRHDNNYRYRNIWLFIDYIGQSGTIKTDTIEYQLSDIYGKWYGKGFGASYEFTAHLNPSDSLNTLKKIIIWQAMRNDTLAGISDIGISLKK